VFTKKRRILYEISYTLTQFTNIQLGKFRTRNALHLRCTYSLSTALQSSRSYRSVKRNYEFMYMYSLHHQQFIVYTLPSNNVSIAVNNCRPKIIIMNENLYNAVNKRVLTSELRYTLFHNGYRRPSLISHSPRQKAVFRPS